MDRKKSIGSMSGRLFCFFAAAVFLYLLTPYLLREFWFDEVLTLQFALLPSAAKIYQSYIIPNNQIVHTVFLHILLGVFPPEILRIFPLFCAGGMLFILWKNFSRELGKGALTVALTALVISPPFLLYATALRGYMLAAFFTVSALCAGRRYALGGRNIQLFYWFIGVLLAVGVMPSALAGIAGAGLYIAPYCGRKFWKNRRLYRLALSAFAAFLLFYLPIKDDLFRAFALKEGWHHAGYALLAVGIAVLLTFLFPFAAGIFYHRPKLRNWPRTLIWFLPLGGAFLPVSPFPRVWFVLFPVFALLAAGFLRRVPEKGLRVSALAVLLFGGVVSHEFFRKQISPALTLAGQDDFYAPRFACREFRNRDTLAVVKENFAPDCPVFASFDADPWALLYFDSRVVFDGPKGKIGFLPGGSAVILAVNEDPGKYAARFGGKMSKIKEVGIHTVYRLEKEDLK